MKKEFKLNELVMSILSHAVAGILLGAITGDWHFAVTYLSGGIVALTFFYFVWGNNAQ
jgi:hypothetical protein